MSNISSDTFKNAPLPRLTYRVSEVATILGISPAKVWKMLADGEIPRIKFGGSTRIRRADIEAILINNAKSAGVVAEKSGRGK